MCRVGWKEPHARNMGGTAAVLILVTLLSQSVGSSPHDLVRLISDTKAELAQSFFTQRLDKKDATKVNVTWEKSAEMNVTGSGHIGRLFRLSGENFVFNGSQLLQLKGGNEEAEGDAEASYSLDTVYELGLEEGVVLFRQFQSRMIMFAVVCYSKAYCRVDMSLGWTGSSFRQRIATRGVVVDTGFFSDGSDLFLILVAESCKVYRWTGSYFDEHEELPTTGARKVAIFRDQDATVIVIAQKEVYSKVFVRRNKKTELTQLLETKNPLDMAPYSIKVDDDVLHFVFVLSDAGSSNIFWWNGRSFSHWKAVDDVVGPGRLHADVISSEVFVFFARRNELRVYHPTETTFDLVHVATLDRDVVSIDVRQEDNETPLVIILSALATDPFLTIDLVSVDVRRVPATDNQMAVTDPVLQCLFDVKKAIEDRGRKLEESKQIYEEIKKRNGRVEMERVTAAEIQLKDFTVNRLRVNPPGKRLEATPSEIKVKLQEVAKKAKDVLRRMESMPPRRHQYRIREDVTVAHMKATRIRVNTLNGHPFDLDEIVSVTKDQTLTGAIQLNTLSANVLTTPSINGVYVKDILLRNKPVQEIMGEYVVQNLRARKIVFGELGRLNGTLFRERHNTTKAPDEVFRGRKTFPKMIVKQLEVKNINNVSAEEWLSKRLPNFRSVEEDAPLNFDELKIKNLTVTNINGMPWEEYLRKLAGETGRRFNKTRVKNLVAKTVNGVAVDSLMTTNTPQNISATLQVSQVTAKRLAAKHINGLPPRTNSRDVEKATAATSDMVFFGNVSASRIIFKKPVNISGLMVDFDRLDDTYWMKSAPQAVTTPVTFADAVTIQDLEVLAVNNRSADLFARRLIFADAVIRGDVTVSPNAEQSPNVRRLFESAVKTTGENRITAQKTFSGNVEARRLFVDVVNGKNVTRGTPPLDANGILEVPEVEIAGNVTVRGEVQATYLNGHNLTDVVSNALMLDDPDLLEKANYTSLTINNLRVDKINGEDVSLRFADNRRKVRIIVEGDLNVPEIRATRVNGIDFDDYMGKVVLKGDTSRVVTGRKVFAKTVTVKRNLEGVVNDLDARKLRETALSRTRQQNVTGEFTVGELNGNNVDVRVIGGVPAERLLFHDSESAQTIDSNVELANVAVIGDITARDFMNGCDMAAALDLDLDKVRRLRNLDVKGDLNWRKDRKNGKGISYFYENAVTRHDEQVITGGVTFLDNVSFGKLNTKHDINDVDLGFIVKDAILRSQPVQEIVQDITFKGTLKADNVLVMDNVVVNHINGIDVLDFDQRLVRKDHEGEIRGKKTFANGFEAFRLNADAVNGAPTDAIIFHDDENATLNFPPTTFHSLKIVDSLRVRRVNDVLLDKFLEERVTRHGNHTVSGIITVGGDLIVTGDAEVPRINDVDLADVIFASGEVGPRVVTGEITFDEVLTIPERVYVETVNGHNVREAYDQALLQDSDEVIHGNVVFAEGLKLEGRAVVVRGLNDCDPRKLVPLPPPRDFGSAELSYRRELEEEIGKMTNASNTLVKPVLFVDVETRATLGLKLLTLGESVARSESDLVEVDVYGKEYRSCGLPSECFCPSQTRLQVSSLNPNSISVESLSSRQYKYSDEGLEINVTTTTVSHNSRCRSTEEESTTVAWRKSGGSTSETSVGADFLSDVKFFRIAESVFIIMAFYVHPTDNQTSSLNTTVYEVDTRGGVMRKVQEIPTRGTQTLDVFWTPRGVVLVIGNGYDSEVFTDSVDSAIYRFDDADNQFVLLRLVKTHGILSITNARRKRDSFIFLVQKQSWPFLILKYNHEYDNYYFSQKLDTSQSRVKSNFLSAASFTTERPGYDGDVFVGIVFSDDTFSLFKYKHIEGFVEDLRQEQKAVRLLQPFWLGSRQYLLAASSGFPSRIYELIQQGYMD